MKQEELNIILETHKKWLNGDKDGIHTDLRNTDSSDAVLRCAIWRYLNSSDAKWRYADLTGANLTGKNLPFLSQLSVCPSEEQLQYMSKLEDLGFVKQKVVAGVIEYVKDGDKKFMICDWCRPGGDTHDVVFHGVEEDIHITQEVILAIAETLKAAVYDDDSFMEIDENLLNKN